MKRLPTYQEILTFSRELLRDKKRAVLLVTLLLAAIEPLFFPTPASAAPTAFVRLDRMGSSLSTGGTICLTASATGTEAKVLVTFPGSSGSADATHYGINQTASNWTVTTTNLPTGASAWPSIATATSVSGGSVIFPSGDLTASTQYCFNFASSSTLSTPTGANTNLTGMIQTQTSGGTAIDTVNFALANVASNNDQIAVTASVAATFSFSLSANTAALSTLSTSTATSATAITATASTNAQNGWIAWIKSANAALNSASTGDSVASGTYQTGSGNITDLASSGGYVVDGQTGTGTPTIATEYAGNGTTSGGNLATTYKQIASKSSPASGNTFTMAVRARASATNKAATDYTDTLTVTAAGQF